MNLFRSSLSTKFRYNIISLNTLKQNLRFHHDNTTSKNPNKFLLQRCCADEKESDNYFSVFSTDSRRISPEKNFYFRFPSGAQPSYPFAIIGDKNNDNNNNNVFYDHEVLKPPYSTRIIGSCDGLICLQEDKSQVDNNVILWNPLINDFKVIDYSSFKRQPRSAPISIFKCAGFGFDSDSKEHKLLMQVPNFYWDKSRKYEGSEYKYEVCSLKTGTWSPIRSPKVVPYVSPWSSIYIDGCCYCGAYDSTDDYILSFNFADERFSHFLMPLPMPETDKFGESESSSDYTFKLVEYEGLLGIVLYKKTGTDKCFELWVREKDESWSKVTEMYVPNVEKPLACWEKDKWFFARQGEVLLFDPATKEVETLDIYDSFSGSMNMIPFVESTSSPHGEVV